MKAITLITTTTFILFFAVPSFAQDDDGTASDSTENLSGQVPIIQDRQTKEAATIGLWEVFSRYWLSPKAYLLTRKHLGL